MDEDLSFVGSKGTWKIDFISEELETAAVSLDFSPYQYGCKLVVASAQPKILIITKISDTWEVETLEENLSIGAIVTQWAPATAKGSIKTLVDNVPVYIPRFAVAGMDKTIKIFEEKQSTGELSKKWNLVYELGNHKDWIRCLAWCPLMSDKAQLAVGLSHGTAIIWTFDGVTNEWSMLVIYVEKESKQHCFVSDLSW